MGTMTIVANDVDNHDETYYTQVHPNLNYVVFDCSGDDETSHWMDRHSIVAEMDYYATERYAPCRCGTFAVLDPGADSYRAHSGKTRDKLR